MAAICHEPTGLTLCFYYHTLEQLWKVCGYTPVKGMTGVENWVEYLSGEYSYHKICGAYRPNASLSKLSLEIGKLHGSRENETEILTRSKEVLPLLPLLYPFCPFNLWTCRFVEKPP